MNIRKHNTRLIAAVVMLAFVALAACAPASESGTFPPTSSAPAATTAPVIAATTAPTSAPAQAPAQPPAAQAAGLQVAKSDKLGSFLADSKGMTLYIFTKDSKDTSNCYDACATKWPALISQGKPRLSGDIKADLIGTTQRKDGSTQVTYNGMPLYYYAADTKAGDTTGQGVGGVWFVISPSGDVVNGNAAPAPAATSAQNTPSASAGVSIKLAQNAKLGDLLVDGKGMTLYLFTKDTKNVSNCYDACAAKWPPLLSDAKPELGDGVKGDLIGTTTRKDGKTQLTYNGWPLYYYAPDGKPGDTTGQGVGSVWYVLSPAGDAITTGTTSSAPAAAPTAAQVAPDSKY